MQDIIDAEIVDDHSFLQVNSIIINTIKLVNIIPTMINPAIESPFTQSARLIDPTPYSLLLQLELNVFVECNIDCSTIGIGNMNINTQTIEHT